MEWTEWARIGLYCLWIIMAALVVKLLVLRERWKHPLRGNGPMLWAMLLILLSVEWTRARNIEDAPPPFVPALSLSYLATFLILYWLWRQMELIPAWIRKHLPWRRTAADYTMKEHDEHVDHHERPGR